MGVIIGMDPHKRSATIEVIDERGQVLAVGRFGTDKAGYAEMLAAGRQHPRRVWAVEGCNGIGKHIAHRLVHDGETVVDVPAKLSAQVRVFATGNGRKTDPVDAHSVAMVALRDPEPGAGRGRRRPGGDGDAGRPPRRARPGPHPDDQPAAPAAAGAVSRRGKQFLSSPQGPRADRHHQAARHRRQDPPPARRRADRRARGHRQEDQGRREGTHRTWSRPADPPDGPARHRPLRRRPAARRRRRHPPLRRPGPVRVLERHRTPRRVLRRPDNATGCPAPATGASTGPCTSWPSSSSATPPKAAPTTTPRRPPARPRWKPCGR